MGRDMRLRLDLLEARAFDTARGGSAFACAPFIDAAWPSLGRRRAAPPVLNKRRNLSLIHLRRFPRTRGCRLGEGMAQVKKNYT